MTDFTQLLDMDTENPYQGDGDCKFGLFYFKRNWKSLIGCCCGDSEWEQKS